MKRIILAILLLALSGCACQPTGEDIAWSSAMAAVHDPVTGAADLIINSCVEKKDD